MKKFLCVLFSLSVFACTLIGFTGCKEKNEKIQIELGMWPEANLTQDIAMYKYWESQFEEAYPQYDIIAAPYTYNLQAFVSDAASGVLPTVFQTWMTEPPSLIENGYIRDITDQLEQLGWLDKLDEGLAANLTVNNRVYGVPRDGYAMGLMINKKIFEEIGIFYDSDGDGVTDIVDEEGNPLYPTTFQEIYEVSQIVCEYTEAKGIAILSSNQNGGWQFSNIAWNFGAVLQEKNANGKWVSHLNSQACIDALEWIQMMKNEDLIAPGVTLPYSDWYKLIGTRAVAMCFAGSDAISMPVTNYNFNKDDLVLVPMPGDGVHQAYSLSGGTPFVFSKDATDEQVLGALRFLEYMGRSPVVSDVARAAIERGHQTAQSKGMPIVPTIKPWKSHDYLAMIEEIEPQYINVNMEYYQEFFDTIDQMRRVEEPNYCQKMYEELDRAIQAVLENPATANPTALLNTANNNFTNKYLNELNK
ncbi:MAG: extracellular solute-binding protein [Clostridia bacterium]|nr:extracellular solute-binding protein [Clostridia bacterium]